MKGFIRSITGSRNACWCVPWVLSRRNMVSLHGNTMILSSTRRRTMGIHEVPEKPPDPTTLLTPEEIEEKTGLMMDWWENKKSVLCLTGAGISTESGVPDYRGHTGSYHHGHKPMIHDRFMNSDYQRKRYWGRGMVGWRNFDQAKPNSGHYALADLERMGKLGVTFEDRPEFYGETDAQFRSGQQQLSLVTQNVDSLHRKAGSVQLTELHGRTDMLQCMKCGCRRSRKDFHQELEARNKEWLHDALQLTNQDTDMRADGDAVTAKDDYEVLDIPSCAYCRDGFLKPSVVFFGDTVPKNRVLRTQAAFDAADGILVVGSSLAVHSAFRHVRAVSQNHNTPVLILNVGETRAEREGLDHLLKIEAPAGPTLASFANLLAEKNETTKKRNTRSQ